jgi:hypothetical protein
MRGSTYTFAPDSAATQRQAPSSSGDGRLGLPKEQFAISANNNIEASTLVVTIEIRMLYDASNRCLAA